MCSLQARKPYVRTAKNSKDVQAKGKRLMREMLVFWKKNEKEERDVRRREQKEAVDRARIEEEKREAARQARKLEFLISQTELYSHFVGNKLKSKSILASVAALADLCDIAAEVQGDEGEAAEVPAGAHVEDVGDELQEIDFDDGQCHKTRPYYSVSHRVNRGSNQHPPSRQAQCPGGHCDGEEEGSRLRYPGSTGAQNERGAAAR